MLGVWNNMPTSQFKQIPKILEIIIAKNPKSILDVGCGFGKYGVLCREYLDIGEDYSFKRTIDAVDIFEDYITPLHKYIYDKIIIGDITKLAKDNLKYNLVLLIDVFEHIDKEEGKQLIDDLLKSNDGILISVPKYIGNPEARESITDTFNNPFEEHIAQWSLNELKNLSKNHLIIKDRISHIIYFGSDSKNIKKIIFKARMKDYILSKPFIKKAVEKRAIRRNKLFKGSKEYWENRYKRGGNSGAGSYNNLARFKADVINSFVKNNKINSVIDFGCGDSNQLSLLDFKEYIGFDISKTSINICQKKFKKDKTKRFFLYDQKEFEINKSKFKADLSLSLDVIFHLVEDNVFEDHLKHLFSSANKFVIIYSSNNDSRQKYHEKNRQFSTLIKNKYPEWELIKEIKNKYPKESVSNFFIYKRK